MNVHLESVRFGKEDYNFVSEITTTPTSNENFKSGTRVIISKMRYAFVKRASQIETISQFIKISPHPVILCGDFNDTPVSYSYRQIANKLNDSFVDAGTGLGQTHAQMLPLLRIDYIFYSKNMKAIDHHTIQKDYSDHFPLVARISLPD
jgi:endonuclease/exonuclease/phosphatase family metal-dependent hydrolase